MIRYVVDASAVGPLIFSDEQDKTIPALLEGLAKGECTVPAHWRFEVANQMLMGLRRKRTTHAELIGTLADFATFRVEVDTGSIDRAWSASFDLAMRHKLTLYDAAYLELAQRFALCLISFDRALIHAARVDGIEVLTA